MRTLKSKKECTRKLVLPNIYKQLHCNVDIQIKNTNKIKYVKYKCKCKANKIQMKYKWKIANLDNINDLRVISTRKIRGV